MCLAVVEGWLHLSLRTTDRERHAGRIARNLGGRRGFGGGHQALAASQIPLPAKNSSDRQTRALVRSITKRFLKATGGASDAGEPLCQ
jgi:nanoRNase/pAp phosphatase (c-di-AMP/oligoRNAs hydrolase)